MVKKWNELSEDEQQKVFDFYIPNGDKEGKETFITLVSTSDYYFDKNGKSYAGVPIEYCPSNKPAKLSYSTTSYTMLKLA